MRSLLIRCFSKASEIHSHVICAVDVDLFVNRYIDHCGLSPITSKNLAQPLELESYASARDDLWTQCLLLRNLELTVQLALQRVSVVALFPKNGVAYQKGAERAPAPRECAPLSRKPVTNYSRYADTREAGILAN